MQKLSKSLSILLMDYLRCKNPVNNGINYLSTGAGFRPSTVSLQEQNHPAMRECHSASWPQLKVYPGTSRWLEGTSH